MDNETEDPTTEGGDVTQAADDTEQLEGEHKDELGEQETTIQGEQDTTTQGEARTEALEEAEGEHFEGEHAFGEEGLLGEGKELIGEQLDEELQGEEVQEEEKKEEVKAAEEEIVEEEEGYVEEPPPDPAAPFDFSDSKEALKRPFELRPDQLAEVEQLWELYQNHTPAYSEISGYITEKELIYMLKCLILMTYTPEQLQELIAYCVRPPHPQGHITYEQFLKMVTIRQRDFSVEDELRSALQVLDPGKTGTIDREVLKELLSKQGHKMPQKLLDNLIKEVDMTNDGTIGIEDVVGTMSIDLNKEDLLMLIASLQPPEEEQPQEM
ncbi:uncharacterized protein [Epargyreus clarus]|uniref:uncharacterized protein n=1 Tax=Epargyreus clarus TaxID=520877 RepID=UPI003C2DFC8F